MKLRAQVAGLLGITLLVYANSLFNSFTMDDELYILRNPQVTQHSARLLFHPNAASNVYRPLTFFTFAMNWIAAGYKPLGYHVINLLLHIAVVLLLFFVLRNILEGSANYELVCFAAALLFAVHPLHTEAVSSVVGRSELLAAGLLLAAWLCHLEDRHVSSLVCVALALLSKESAIGLLPLVAAGDYAKGQLKSWTRYAAIAAVSLLYLGGLWKIQGGHFGAATVSVLDNPLSLLPASLRILNAVRIAWKYLALLVLPITLSCDYSYNQIPLYADARHLLIPAIAATALLLAWIWAIWKKRTGYIVAGAVYFAGFAATSNILTRTGTIFGERLAYLPSAGFCLLAALAWRWLAGRHRHAAVAVLALLVPALGIRTVVRNRDWRDNAALYTAAGNAVPNSAKMRAFRGIIYLGEGQFDRSRADLEAALNIHPEFPDAVEAMGLLEARSGNSTEALNWLQKALDISDRGDIDYDYRAVNLAALDMQIGRLDEAMKLLNRDIAESPRYSRSWSNRAVLRLKLGQVAEAREDARTALALDPNNRQARNILDRPASGPLL
jgi:tetratricopeptide (TPR) repeat protein